MSEVERVRAAACQALGFLEAAERDGKFHPASGAGGVISHLRDTLERTRGEGGVSVPLEKDVLAWFGLPDTESSEGAGKPRCRHGEFFFEAHQHRFRITCKRCGAHVGLEDLEPGDRLEVLHPAIAPPRPQQEAAPRGKAAGGRTVTDIVVAARKLLWDSYPAGLERASPQKRWDALNAALDRYEGGSG